MTARRAPLSAWLAPEYPRVSLDQARLLRRGQSPMQLARAADPQCEFARSEAHRWLTEAPAAAPLAWLASSLGAPGLRSWLVAAWLRRVLGHPAEREALRREREFRGPAGQTVRVRFADRLDEIQDEDLDRGPATGVQRAFERAAARYGEAHLAGLAKDFRVLSAPPEWRLGTRVRCLTTPAALVAEGREMRHCVGGYASAVERGQCVILAIATRGHRSTVEISPAGQIRQHKGPSDGHPHPACAAALRSFLRRNGLPSDDGGYK